MSRSTYQIQYDPAIRIDLGQIISILNEISRQIEQSRKSRVSKLEWIPRLDNEPIQKPQFEADKPIFEAQVPPEFTEDVHVFNEVLRVTPINDKTIQVMITDASVPSRKCEEIVVNFSQQLYEKATGRKITKEQILIKNIAGLPENICEHCLQSIEGLPYACKVCGRTFCYDHRRPETHSCQTKVKLNQPEPPIAKPRPSIPRTDKTQPRVTVRKIPCG